jgi:hypothetical protein
MLFAATALMVSAGSAAAQHESIRDTEGALRWNILPHYTWNPYVFVGAGWQRYDITDANRRRTSVTNSEETSM